MPFLKSMFQTSILFSTDDVWSSLDMKQLFFFENIFGLDLICIRLLLLKRISSTGEAHFARLHNNSLKPIKLTVLKLGLNYPLTKVIDGPL